MKNRTILYCLLLALVFSLSASKLTLAKTNLCDSGSQRTENKANSSKTSIGFKDLSLKIKTPKQDYMLLEPIALVISLENETNHSVECNFRLAFSTRRSQLLVGKVGEELSLTNKVLSSKIDHVVFRANKIVKPKDFYEQRETLKLSLTNLFPSAGEYEIQLLQLDSTGKHSVYSNKITIKISEPTGKNLTAYHELVAMTDPNNPFDDGNTSKDKEQLNYLARKFPDTIYGKQAAYQLGQLAFFRKDYVSAVEYSEPLAIDKDFVFTDEVLFILADSFAGLGNKDQATKYFERLLKEYPNSRYANRNLNFGSEQNNEN